LVEGILAAVERVATPCGLRLTHHTTMLAPRIWHR